MSSQTLILYDSDPRYSERFVRYIRSREHLPLIPDSAADPETLTRKLRGVPDAILLLQESLLPTVPEEILQRESLSVCLLCDGDNPPGHPGPGIRRSQSMSSLLAELLSLCGTPGALGGSGEKDGWILGIFAPAPTALSSAVSRVMARILAERTSVLHLSLAGFPGQGDMAGEEKNTGLSEFLFRRSCDPDSAWIPELVCGRDRLRHLPSAVNPEDIWQLADEELGRLPGEILRQSGTDILVADFPCSRDPRAFLGSCRHVLLPAEDTPDGRQALRSFREYLVLQGRDELLSRMRELILPPCPELASCSAADPMLRHTPLGSLLEEEAELLLS